ncbi:DUF1189 family protein [Bacillus massiliigorillae]|uniref:DUF1189 family protein n=1 Tax=Bacillus massiliigorillae TaxID=1243664 RepID=UPI00039FE254|nr:DUF1189 family protein [Bacillus massiliigorillae]
MNLIDQFVASIGFSAKKVASWRKQSMWKSFFYVLLLVLISNVLIAGYALYKGSQNTLYDQVKQIEEFSITKEGLQKQGGPQVISLPQLEMMIVIGSDQTSQLPMHGMKNIVALGEKEWSYGRVGFPGAKFSYENFPLLSGQKDGVFDLKDSIALAKDVSPQINLFAPLYQYTNVMIDLIVHLAIISMLALAGYGFKKFVKISYKEAWTITAYGISAPIFVKTVFDLLGFEISFFFLLYWSVVGFFALRTIRAIKED